MIDQRHRATKHRGRDKGRVATRERQRELRHQSREYEDGPGLQRQPQRGRRNRTSARAVSRHARLSRTRWQSSCVPSKSPSTVDCVDPGTLVFPSQRQHPQRQHPNIGIPASASPALYSLTHSPAGVHSATPRRSKPATDPCPRRQLSSRGEGSIGQSAQLNLPSSTTNNTTPTKQRRRQQHATRESCGYDGCFGVA